MKILIKTPEQISGIRKSCALAKKTLDFIQPFIMPGISTAQINRKINEFITSHDAKSACLGYNGFPAESCTSLNEVVCHGIPSEQTILNEGDIIKIDVTTILNGYFGDTCRTFTVGHVNKRVKKLIEATEDCLRIGINQVKPDNYFQNIGYQITSYARLLKYGVIHQFCGHGTGLFFHEAPQIVFFEQKKNQGEKMKPGMIFTIEPMISEGSSDIIIDEIDHWTARTKDGKLAAQFEHTVLVTETGVEILT